MTIAAIIYIVFIRRFDISFTHGLAALVVAFMIDLAIVAVITRGIG